jgi:hypothetical protein
MPKHGMLTRQKARSFVYNFIHVPETFICILFIFFLIYEQNKATSWWFLKKKKICLNITLDGLKVACLSPSRNISLLSKFSSYKVPHSAL